VIIVINENEKKSQIGINIREPPVNGESKRIHNLESGCLFLNYKSNTIIPPITINQQDPVRIFIKTEGKLLNK